jgi:hypothetical protein
VIHGSGAGGIGDRFGRKVVEVKRKPWMKFLQRDRYGNLFWDTYVHPECEWVGEIEQRGELKRLKTMPEDEVRKRR